MSPLLKTCSSKSYLAVFLPISTIEKTGSIPSIFNFEAQTGYLNLTGSELLHYPELAKHLQKIKDYPCIQRKFEAPEELRKKTGIDFLLAFTDFAKQCHESFETERALIATQVNNLIQLYGVEKPILKINALIRNENDRITGIEINNVAFSFYCPHSSRGQNPTSTIFLSTVLAGDKKEDIQNSRINVEEIIAGSPYFSIRYRKTYGHKGHVVWYNINTMQRKSTAEINAFKKSKLS